MKAVATQKLHLLHNLFCYNGKVSSVFPFAHLPARETFLSVLWLCTSGCLAMSPWQPPVSSLGDTYCVCVCVCVCVQCSHSQIPLLSVCNTRVCLSVNVPLCVQWACLKSSLSVGPWDPYCPSFLALTYTQTYTYSHTARSELLNTESFEVWHEN